MKNIKVVAAVIVENNKIFATQRGYGEYKGGWEFPGGKIEAGETAEEALVREIREELDTEIKIEEILCNVQYDYPDFHLDMDCFVCSRKNGKLVLLEHEDAKWLDFKHLNSVSWLPADISVVNEIKAQGIID